MYWDNKRLPIHFVKNEEGAREAKQISEEEITDTPAKKNIGVLVIGHVHHGKTAILELLNRNAHNIPAEIVMIEQQQAPQYPVGSMESLVQKIENDIVMDLSRIRDMVEEIFLEPRNQYPDPRSYPSPKPQKAKSNHRRYIPRKT